MAILNGSDIVLECLLEQGVDTIFGYPGGAILNIYDALYKYQDKITHILTAHEQGAAHAADGYARSTGKVGVCMATSGPGATNLVTGIATAYMDSIPMVAITCNVVKNQLGKDSFQEIDIVGVTMPITKHNYIVKDVTKLADTIREAFLIAKSGRPGPVLIDITKDVTAATTEYEFHPDGKLKAADTFERTTLCRMISPNMPSDDKIQEVADLINGCKKPYIYAGGGVVVSEAYDELKSIAEKINAPVGLSLMGMSAFPNSHPLCTGMIGMHGTKASNKAAHAADIVLCIGTRFSDRVIGDSKKWARNAKIIQIDIDPAEVNKMISVEKSLVGNVKSVLLKLTPLLTAKKNEDWLKEVAEWKKQLPPCYTKKSDLNPRSIYEIVRENTKGDAIIATEVGQHQMWTAQFYKFEKPRTLLTSGGLGTMGYGTGAAIGAQIANPDKRVVSFAGDGSFRMNCNELATIDHYKLPVIIVVVNNGVLGNVRMWQTLFYGKRYSQTDLPFGPDFVKLAEAYGIQGYRAKNEAEFKDAFEKAWKSKKAAIIDAQIFVDEMIYPMIPPGKPIEDMIEE